MLSRFDQEARSNPDGLFFRFREDRRHGDPVPDQLVSYGEARLSALALYRHLERAGYHKGDALACDMSNCPAFVYLFLACLYGEFMLVTLNYRLTDEEKSERLLEVSMAKGLRPVRSFHEQEVLDLLSDRRGREEESALAHIAQHRSAVVDPDAQSVLMFSSGSSGKAKGARLSGRNLRDAAEAFNVALGEGPEVMWQAALPLYHVGGLQIVVRSMMNQTSFLLYRHFDPHQVLQDAKRYRATHISVVDKMLHELLDEDERWAMDELSEALVFAEDDEMELEEPASFHARLGEGETDPVDLDPDTPPSSGGSRMVDGEEDPVDASSDIPLDYHPLRCYDCILLGGGPPNPVSLQAAAKLNLRLFSSYGMTETSSIVAYAPVTQWKELQLSLLPGYEVCIVAPNEDGIGQLGLKGPGLFRGYLGSSIALTGDGFFLTGDSARLINRRIVIAERLEDMFISGGENIYPEEIRRKILQIPRVSDAHVYGVPDEEWGRRPVALVEMANTEIDYRNAIGLTREIRHSLRQRLARIYMPDQLYVLQRFDRQSIGKIDRATLESRVARALRVAKVELFRLCMPLIKPIQTAKTLLSERELLVVKVTDVQGRTGIGECVAFSSDWYGPETIDSSLKCLERQLIPSVLGEAFLQVEQVAGALASCSDAPRHPLACASLEMALWDLHGKICNQSLAYLIGAKEHWDTTGMPYRLPAGVVPGGVVLGIAPVELTVKAVKDAVAAGYMRVKLKIRPGDDLEPVRAIRALFPKLMLVLDANQSYTEQQEDLLHELDRLGCACIEEPLDPQFVPSVGPKDLHHRLARLQRSMSTPLALDESWTTTDDARRALELPDLRCLVLKVGKCGGILPALELYWHARSKGASVWMGGMYDMGISKRVHGAFSLLPGVALPGDISSSSRYFPVDITTPPFELDRGCVRLNPTGYEAGIGCELNERAVDAVLVDHQEFSA